MGAARRIALHDTTLRDGKYVLLRERVRRSVLEAEEAGVRS